MDYAKDAIASGWDTLSPIVSAVGFAGALREVRKGYAKIQGENSNHTKIFTPYNLPKFSRPKYPKKRKKPSKGPPPSRRPRRRPIRRRRVRLNVRVSFRLKVKQLQKKKQLLLRRMSKDRIIYKSVAKRLRYLQKHS